MRGYALKQDKLFKKELIRLAKEASESIFGKNGICPVEPGQVSIVPGFINPPNILTVANIKPTVEIFLYDTEERTSELIDQIQTEFEKAMNGRFSIKINSQPAELFVTV